jgi:hypothetical protein
MVDENLFAKADAFVRGFRKRFSSIAGTYRRGAESVDLDATPARSGSLLAEDDLSFLTSQQEDLLVDVADLVLDGQATVPADGDTWERGTLVWEVRPNNGEPCFRYADGSRSVFRIHLKLKSES